MFEQNADINQREQQTVSYFFGYIKQELLLLMLSVNVDGCVIHVHVHCIL